MNDKAKKDLQTQEQRIKKTSSKRHDQVKHLKKSNKNLRKTVKKNQEKIVQLERKSREDSKTIRTQAQLLVDSKNKTVEPTSLTKRSFDHFRLIAALIQECKISFRGIARVTEVLGSFFFVKR